MSKVNFQPSNGYILLAMKEVKETTDSGIVLAPSQIAEAKKNTDAFRTVVAVSEGSKFKEGDEVIISVLSVVLIDGVEYGLGHEPQVVGKRIK